MKTRLFWAAGLVLLVAGAWVAAQEMQLDSDYVNRAAALRADDAAGHYDLAKWALKKELYHEASAEANKMLALDSGDLRAKYLKQEAEYYLSGGTGTPPAAVKPAEGAAAVTAGSATAATSATGATGENVASGAAVVKPAVAAGPMTKEQVDALYKTFDKNMLEFRSTIQPLLVNKCGSDTCHGSPEHAGRFHLKKTALQERATVAENFRAMDAYVNPDQLDASRLLTMSLAKKDVHPSEAAPVFVNENEAGYKLLKSFILKLPSGAELRWGTSH